MKPAIASLLVLLVAGIPAAAGELELNFRTQVETEPDSGRYHTVTESRTWDAENTAVVICDMWDDHYCRNAARRVAEMAPRMDRLIAEARERGALIIHCPSGCMDEYADTPQRQRAKEAPKVETDTPLRGWCYLDAGAEPPMPVKTEQPCDDEGELRERKRFYSRQIDALAISEGDAITDSAEAYYLMKERGIENVLIMGVHTNKCVLGRPFGIRQMVRLGQDVALVRDMTDSMYNPREEPHVSHFTGNDLVVDHVERHWCPTVTSDDILPGESSPFHFPGDDRDHVVIVMGETHYDTDETLPPFALEELGKDFEISLVYADAEKPDHFPGLEVLRDADVLLLSVRRRNPTPGQMALFREHLEAGKSLVGIRTASHPFHQRKPDTAPEGLTQWRDFDPEILGGNYHGHHGGKLTTLARVVKENAGHPILEGVGSRRFQVFGGLYEVRPLEDSTTPLLTGRAHRVERTQPVAWTHVSPAGGRVFYTSLGHPYDFETPQFRRLLRNALYWAVEKESGGKAEPTEERAGDDDC